MKRLFEQVTDFVFPRYCPVCHFPISTPYAPLCLQCEYHLPRTNYSEMPDNPVAQLFWGRAPVKEATALFRFEKGSAYQSVLHELKYKGNKEIGIYLGRLLGSELRGSCFSLVDCIIPVPLHRKRLKTRGYNQSALIADGISQVLDIPVSTDILVRKTATSSQTNKGRFERFLNMKQVFRLNEKYVEKLPESVLLVDDVVTTGSTLEACAIALSEISGIRILVATVACA